MTTETWKRLNDIDSKFLEPIEGTTRTAINPQYRLQKLNEEFGDCGVGWGWEFKERWSEKWGTTNCVFVRLNLWYLRGDQQYATGDQIGGTYVGGNHPDAVAPDDVYKAAVTDAIGKCAAALGLGADVYMGVHGFPPAEKPAAAQSEPAPSASKPVARKKKAEAVVETVSPADDDAPQPVAPLPGQKELPGLVVDDPFAASATASAPAKISEEIPF